MLQTVVKRWIRDTVENVGNILETKIPDFWRGISAVHESVDGSFEGLISAFEEVLVLVIRFATPKANPK